MEQELNDCVKCSQHAWNANAGVWGQGSQIESAWERFCVNTVSLSLLGVLICQINVK